MADFAEELSVFLRCVGAALYAYVFDAGRVLTIKGKLAVAGGQSTGREQAFVVRIVHCGRRRR